MTKKQLLFRLKIKDCKKYFKDGFISKKRLSYLKKDYLNSLLNLIQFENLENIKNKNIPDECLKLIKSFLY